MPTKNMLNYLGVRPPNDRGYHGDPPLKAARTLEYFVKARLLNQDFSDNSRVRDCYREDHTYDGIYHRDPRLGPARIVKDERGTTKTFLWRGRVHREDGPAVIAYDSCGNLWYEKFVRYGYRHRHWTEGPAFIEYKDGQVCEETYYYCDKIYRDPSHGPSQIWRDANGEICRVRNSVMRSDLSRPIAKLERASRLFRLPAKPWTPFPVMLAVWSFWYFACAA